MAKAKKPKTPKTSHFSRSATQLALDAIGNRLHYVLCQITCANQVLDASSAVKGCEDATRAQIIVHQLVSDLDQIHIDLDRFAIDHLREEVAS